MFDCNCGNGSFVKVSSKEIIKLANETLKSIRQYREKTIQRRIDKEKKKIVEEREKRAARFWNRWLNISDVNKPLPSNEEIMKIISINEHPFDSISFIEISFSKDEDIAQRLLNVAQHTDEIYVSVEEFSRLV